MTNYTPAQLRRLDALVAERVMGWHVYWSAGEFVDLDGTPVHDWRGRERGSYCRDFIYKYTIDIAAAWELVEKLKEQGEHIEIGNSMHQDMRPLAICLAALKAAGVDIEAELFADEFLTENRELMDRLSEND